MAYIVLVLHLISCLVLIVVVLLQAGKGAEMGAAFGGASKTVFGARGAAGPLAKVTVGVAVMFMLSSLYLTWDQKHLVGKSVVTPNPTTTTSPAPTNTTPTSPENPMPVIPVKIGGESGQGGSTGAATIPIIPTGGGAPTPITIPVPAGGGASSPAAPTPVAPIPPAPGNK